MCVFVVYVRVCYICICMCMLTLHADGTIAANELEEMVKATVFNNLYIYLRHVPFSGIVCGIMLKHV